MRVIDSLGNIKQSILGIAASGTIKSGHLADGSVISGSIGSGQVFRFHLASGAANSGHIASGAIVGAAGGGTSNIASGSILQGGQQLRSNIASGAFQSGHFASGQIGTFHLLYRVQPAAGRPAVTPGASYSLAQTIVDTAQYQAPLSSGLNFADGLSLIAGENISGGRAVVVISSGDPSGILSPGRVYIAMPDAAGAIQGRMPAFGIVMDNVLSGLAVTVYQHGVFQFTSGLANMSAAVSGYGSYSGFLGRTLVVGLSGQIATFISGGQWLNPFGGIVRQIQRLGIAINSGGFIANVDPVAWSGSNVGAHWNLGI